MRIGITGGIGSGKSYVSGLLRKRGFHVYDCDSEAKRLMVSDKHIVTGLRQLLGDDAFKIDGTLNRPFIASRLFGDEQMRAEVNALVHPCVKADFLRWAEEQGGDLVFIESAILFDAGIDKVCDGVILVTAPQELRLQRVSERDQIPVKDILSRMESQQTDEALMSKADHIIVNDGRSLNRQINKLLKEFEKSII